VLAGAVYGTRWKADASVFNGREPDERRANIDLDRLDSFSGRLSMNPTSGIALQVSAGHLHDAEAGLGTQPRRDVNRVTMSAIVLRGAGPSGTWATTFAYGLRWGLSNVAADVIQQTTHAGLVETSYSQSRAATWFGRFEVTGKPAHDLHADEFSPAVFTVAKLQAGYVRFLPTVFGVRTGVGGTFSLSLLPPYWRRATRDAPHQAAGCSCRSHRQARTAITRRCTHTSAIFISAQRLTEPCLHHDVHEGSRRTLHREIIINVSLCASVPRWLRRSRRRDP
jgi:hypothetical protein